MLVGEVKALRLPALRSPPTLSDGRPVEGTAIASNDRQVSAAYWRSTSSWAAAEAGVRLARQNALLVEKVDQTLAADLDRQAATAALDQSALRAPQVEGGSAEFTVLRTMVDPGELIAQTPVVDIADLSRMSCVAEVYEADAKEIKVGQGVTLRSPAFTGKSLAQ